MSATVIIYEYMIKDKELKVIKHNAEIRKDGEFYAFRGIGKGAAYRFIEPKQLGVPKNRRVCVLERDDEKYRALLIQYTKERISALEEQVKKEKEILEALKGKRDAL